MGANKISMVGLEVVGKYMKKKHDVLDEFRATENAYLAGMKEVLQEIATKRYLELSGPISENIKVRKAIEDSIKAYDRLNSRLNEEDQKLLGYIESTYNYHQALSEEEVFVNGFLEGYRFIKELYQSVDTVVSAK